MTSRSSISLLQCTPDTVEALQCIYQDVECCRCVWITGVIMLYLYIRPGPSSALCCYLPTRWWSALSSCPASCLSRQVIHIVLVMFWDLAIAFVVSLLLINCNCNWGTCIAPPTRRPSAHHRVNPYPRVCRQNETEMFSDYDETSPSIAAEVWLRQDAIQIHVYLTCLYLDHTYEWKTFWQIW